MADLQTVTFQAAKTNSIPPPIPYHIEQGLRGEVGTTRLPSALSSVATSLLKLIALLNFAGVAWILWPMPVIALLMGTCIAGVSLSLAGLFHGIPYLEQRRNSWTPTNWRLLHLCFAISWAASATVAYFLIFYPPVIPSKMVSQRYHGRTINDIRADLETASRKCLSRGDPYHCRWQDDFSAELAQARREIERREAKYGQPKAEETEEDKVRKFLVFLASALALGAVHGIAAYGAPFSSETGNAIWREPHSGYSGKPASSAPPMDPEEKLKREGLNRWLRADRVAIGSGPESEPVDKVFEEYRKFLGEQIVMPPAYDTVTFKKAFKEATNKDAQDIKGVETYLGVSFPGAGLG